MINDKKDFSCRSFIEIKTFTGQVINVECRSEDKEKIKKLSELIYHADLPVTKEIKEVCHGGYGRYSRFNIEQKKYAGGECGYIECIKINNPPENRNGNIIHQCESSNSVFYEFNTIENAIDSWEKTWSRYADELISKSKGFIRKVNCGWFSPWFYAVANQALYGDFSFPERVGTDHPIYRPFNKFIVEKDSKYNYDTKEYDKIYEIKTCIGYNEEKIHDDYNKEYINYIIYWDDGTSWNDSSLKNAPISVKKNNYKIILKTQLCDYTKRKNYDK